jgi:hypothetical protein
LASIEPAPYYLDAASGGTEHLKADIYSMTLWYHLSVEFTDQCQFIEGTLTEEYSLDNTESEKPLLEAEDFVEVIRYHWVSDINIFPNERQSPVRGNSAAGCIHRFKPLALLSLTYRDLSLYVDKDKNTGEHVLKLGVQLTKTKSRQKRKRP